MGYQYQKKEQSFGNACFISPAREVLKKYNRPKEESFPTAQYLWPYGYTRFHAFRLFTPKSKVIKAEAAFLCDNLFDIWLNGTPIASDITHLSLTDITNFIADGENNLHIRGYQSRTDETFSAAITGGVRLTYADGSVEEIVTDSSFQQVRLLTFWENEEPEGFETETAGQQLFAMNVMPLHPIALRRSFCFIRRFSVKKELKSAYLLSSALGYYEPYLNGKRICDDFFMPFCMNKQKEYQKFNLLPLLQKGENTIGMILFNGSYNCSSWGNLSAKVPEMLAELQLEYADGASESIVTDENWRCIPSPLIENDLQYGERYDARLEIPNWCTNEADSTLFLPVTARKNAEHPFLLEQSYPPVRRMKEYPMREYRLLKDGSPIFDTGLCIAGRARVVFKNLPAGKKVRIRYCERLNAEQEPENGPYVTVYYDHDCDPHGKTPNFMRNMDIYYAKGDAREIYECRAAYTGFRYIWIEGLDSLDQLEQVVAFELYNDIKMTGSLASSYRDISRIFQASRRSWLNNISNGPTDCPTREKNYWNGDSQIFSHAACWLTDNSALLSRWTDNGIKMHPGPYAWEDETYEIPWTLYRFYGDKSILRHRFSEMLSLIKRRQEFPDMILPVNGISHQYNDWLSPEGISPTTEFFGGCWYIRMLDRVSEIATVLGEAAVAQDLRQRADASRKEFNRRHLINGNTDYDAQNQCGIVLPVAFGIAPEECRQALADTLAEYVKKANYHITTGFIGIRFLLEVLCDYGHADIAYRLLDADTVPSWKAMLNTGATAITESWYGLNDPDRSLGMCHFSLGSVVGWFFEYLGGIRINECQPGFTEIVLKPVMLEAVGDFSATYQSAVGEIHTEWHFENGKPIFSYRVPEGIPVKVIL